MATVGIFIADCSVPRGISISALYVIPISLMQRARSTGLTVTAAVGSGVFASVGIMVAPDIGIPANIVIFNYGIIMLVIGATTLLGILATRRTRQLQTVTRLLTLCAWTKQVKVRGEWRPIEVYLRDDLGITVTHGIADECAKRLLAEAGVEFHEEADHAAPGSAMLRREHAAQAAA